VQILEIDRAAEMAHGRDMRVRSWWPKITNAQRLLERETARHEFAKDRFQGAMRQDAAARGEGPIKNFRFPVRRVDGESEGAFHSTHFDDKFGATIEHFDKRLIKRGDLVTNDMQAIPLRCAGGSRFLLARSSPSHAVVELLIPTGHEQPPNERHFIGTNARIAHRYTIEGVGNHAHTSPNE